MLYITYNNTDHTDGAGSQIQRQISLYMIANYYGVRYIHSPLTQLDYQGLHCLETNTSDNLQLDQYNALFDIPSCSDVPETFDEIHTIKYLQVSDIEKWKSSSKSILIKALYGHQIIDTHPEILQSSPPQYPWIRQISSNSHYPLQIVVHVRRGEIRIVDTHRLLPKEYYITCMKALETILTRENIPYEFHIYGEYNKNDIIVTPTHHGICNRIEGTVVMKSDADYFDDFKQFSNTIFHLNESPVDALCALIHSDCLIASKSSFSYVAAILQKKKCILFPCGFWHATAVDWIVVNSENDIYRNVSEWIKMNRI